MIRTALLCVSVLQMVMSEPISSKCQMHNFTSQDNPLDCCPLPDVFTDEEYKECGLKYYKKYDDGEKIVFKSMDDYCNRLKCLLNKYNLMKDEINVDKEAVGEFMDKWADTNEDFRTAVKIAKDKCLREDLSKTHEQAYELCQPNIFVYCTSLTIYLNCPIWQDRQICREVKEYSDECMHLFL